MTLATAADLVERARKIHAGIGAFNVVQLETAEALVQGAESAGLGVILQISQNCADYHGGLAPVARASLALAERASVPVAVHLDHAEREDLVREAIDLGLGSVMFDASKLPYEDNLARTAAIVAEAHAAGVWVEGELGEVGGKDGAHAPGVRTDPAEARGFVDATGVDALAVAVGSSHAMTERSASLDDDLIGDLRRALDVPLVLHGSSGVADDRIVAAIAAGMTKINVSTHLNGVYTAEVRRALAADEKMVDPRKYVRPAREATAREVARLLTLFAG